MPALDSVHIRAATRGSALALWQTDHVSELLARAASSAGISLTFERVVVETVADARLDIPIWEMGGKGVFVKEIQAAVLDGRADIAVHSGKDLPARTPDELVLAAVPERADPRDILIGSTLAGLRHGATVASGSVRRRAQLAALRPDLVFEGLRGNIAKRLEKSFDFDAIVMAVAAIERLGLDLSDRVVEILEPEVMLPQVAQGALAIECSVSDDAIRTLLAMIEHAPSRIAVDAERAFLDELGGDCNLPAGAFATIDENTIIIEGLLASFDGQTVIRDRRVVDISDGATTGRSIARYLLDDLGGSALLDR